MKTIWKATVCIVAVLLSFSIYSCGDDLSVQQPRKVSISAWSAFGEAR